MRAEHRPPLSVGVLRLRPSVCCSSSKYASCGLAASDWSTLWVAPIVYTSVDRQQRERLTALSAAPLPVGFELNQAHYFNVRSRDVRVFFVFFFLRASAPNTAAVVKFELSQKKIQIKKMKRKKKLSQSEEKHNTCFVRLKKKKDLFTLYSSDLLAENH